MMRKRRTGWLPVGLVVSLALVLTGVGVSSAVAPVDVWWLSNTPGFGDPDTQYITALGTFQDLIYAGTASKLGDGPTQLWRRDGRFGAWSHVGTGLGSSNNLGIDAFVEFNSKLYAGIWNDTDGAQIQRSADGLVGELVVSGGKGNAYNTEASALAVFGSRIYAGSLNEQDGAEIWRSDSGDGGTWTAVVTGGNGSKDNAGIGSFEVFDGKLYAAVFNSGGGRVWRTKTGTGAAGDWEDVTRSGGFGFNHSVLALGVLGNYLYASTMGDNTDALRTSATVWRCSTCDGTDWTKVLDGTVLSPYANMRSSLITLPIADNPVCTLADPSPATAGPARPENLDALLFFVVGNAATGMEVWMTGDGAAGTWGQIGFAGFGDPHNQLPYADSSATIYRNHLFVGTINKIQGGEIYQLLPCVYQMYLPLVSKW